MIFMVGSIGAMGSFAYFTDQVNTDTNTIHAGTLVLNDATIGAIKLSVDNAIPDSTPHNLGSAFLIQNDGSVPGKLTATISADSLNTAGQTAFGNYLEIDIKNAAGNFVPIYKNGAVIPVTLSENFVNGAGNGYQEQVQFIYTRDLNNAQTQGGNFPFKIQFELRQI